MDMGINAWILQMFTTLLEWDVQLHSLNKASRAFSTRTPDQAKIREPKKLFWIGTNRPWRKMVPEINRELIAVLPLIEFHPRAKQALWDAFLAMLLKAWKIHSHETHAQSSLSKASQMLSKHFLTLLPSLLHLHCASEPAEREAHASKKLSLVSIIGHER